MTHTLTVRGMKVRTRTTRRYVLVAARPEPYTDSEGRTYPPFIEVEKRSDSLATVAAWRKRYGWSASTSRVIVDLTTGEEF